MATAKLLMALVLCDVVSHGLKAGQLLEASPELIKALTAEGSVDAHKDAIAAAKTAGAQVARSSIELAAEQLAATIDALRVEIAQLEDLHAKAEGETQAALAGQVTAKKAELAALLAPPQA